MLANNNNIIMSTEYCDCTNGGTRALCRPVCGGSDEFKKTKCMNAVRQQGIDPCHEDEGESIYLPIGKCIYIFCHYSWLIIVRLQWFQMLSLAIISCELKESLEILPIGYASRIIARVGRIATYRGRGENCLFLLDLS